jgi:transcriptional regulator with XRE-family HTH domain
MAKIREREQARKLRAKGISIDEIARKLLVSKSTVSYWCRDIPLTKNQIENLAKRSRNAGVAALMKASERKRTGRIESTKVAKTVGSRAVGKLNKRDVYMLGLALYWGEGYKSGNEEFGFTNSDPSIVQTYITWLEKIYNVKKKDLTLRVSINKLHKDRVSTVIQHWSKFVGVPKSQFTKTSLIKTTTKKHYSNRNQHFGTLRIKVRRGAPLRRQVLGSLEEIYRQITK